MMNCFQNFACNFNSRRYGMDDLMDNAARLLVGLSLFALTPPVIHQTNSHQYGHLTKVITCTLH